MNSYHASQILAMLVVIVIWMIGWSIGQQFCNGVTAGFVVTQAILTVGYILLPKSDDASQHSSTHQSGES